MAKQKLIFIKLGGSLITDKSKPFTPRLETIARLAGEIQAFRNKVGTNVLVGHGGGSFPHVPAKKYRTVEGFVNESTWRGFAEVENAAAKLNRIVIGTFLNQGVTAVGINPSNMMITRNRDVASSFMGPIGLFLEKGVLPIIYGDAILDQYVGCTILSTEMIMLHLARKLRDSYAIAKIIHCGLTNGVLNHQQETIPVLSESSYSQYEIGESIHTDVTGGMLHKVRSGFKIARPGVKVEIINGNVTGNLNRALIDEERIGTIIV